MAKFILIYNGAATDMADMTPEQGADVMAKWTTWMGEVGSALVDVGSPFGKGTSLVDNGATASAIPLSGYSIIEASDLGAALKLAAGHPFLTEGLGNYAVEVYELLPVPFQQ